MCSACTRMFYSMHVGVRTILGIISYFHHAGVCLCMRVHTCVCMCARVFYYMHVEVREQPLDISSLLPSCRCVFVCACTHVYACMHVCVLQLTLGSQRTPFMHRFSLSTTQVPQVERRPSGLTVNTLPAEPSHLWVPGSLPNRQRGFTHNRMNIYSNRGPLRSLPGRFYLCLYFCHLNGAVSHLCPEERFSLNK